MRVLCWVLLVFAAQAQTARFQRVAEPKEGAFTLLVPAGWRTSGGIARVNPLTANGALNTTAAKLDFTVQSPDGKITLRWYPETNYFDMRGNAAQAMFPQGSNYNGAPVWPKLGAAAYLEQIVFRQAHRDAKARLTRNEPLPKVAASYEQLARQLGIPVDLRFDAALLVVEYQESGARWEEALYTAVQDWGVAGAGLWTNKDTFSMRTPVGELDKTGKLAAVILNSVQLNPKWVEGELRGQMERNEIARRTQQELARMDREIVAHRQRTNAEINNQIYHNLMGTEEYVNPLSKKTEVGSNAWNYRWVNEAGESIYTDDPNYDPGRAGLSGFVKSPVRKRFPEK